jgi:hypothetical protein
VKRAVTLHGGHSLSERNGENEREVNAMSNDVKKKKIAYAANDEPFGPEVGRILYPDRFFRHPNDVVIDATLSIDEKRAILSSWASDACAVESMPALRQVPGSGTVVRFDDVIDALRKLDEGSAEHSSNRLQPERRIRRRGNDSEDGPTGTGNWL